MNTVEISGGHKYQRKLCDSVINYTIKKLLPRLRTLEINVELTNILDDATGYCMIGDNNREFYIEIDKNLSHNQKINILLHEMCHHAVEEFYEYWPYHNHGKEWKREMARCGFKGKIHSTRGLYKIKCL